MRTGLENSTPRISSLCRDPALKAVFLRAERDNPPLPVEPARPLPVLNGNNAVRVLEFA